MPEEPSVCAYTQFISIHVPHWRTSVLTQHITTPLQHLIQPYPGSVSHQLQQDRLKQQHGVYTHTHSQTIQSSAVLCCWIMSPINVINGILHQRKLNLAPSPYTYLLFTLPPALRTPAIWRIPKHVKEFLDSLSVMITGIANKTTMIRFIFTSKFYNCTAVKF